ncbi:MAG TPA: hypothetical protein VHA33_30665 [Candidatus Angelobacter sp.]|nr:hypothetical protein [Candidatus Angelobacter sp.]
MDHLTRKNGYSIAHEWQFWVRERTIDDVKVFLRKIDWDDLREVFDRTREQYTRRTQSGDHLRKIMRTNLLKAREFLSRMSHNAQVVQEWANTELKKLRESASGSSANSGHQLRETAQMAADFRSLSRMQRIKVTAWMTLRIDCWPVSHMPSVASLRNLGGNGELDLIRLYEELKKDAAKLALPYGQQFHDDVLAGL